MKPIRLQSIGFISNAMFLTHEAHKSAIHGIFCKTNESHWHAVEVLSPSPWFLATIEEVDSTARGRSTCSNPRTVLLTSIDHLLGLATHGDDNGIRLRAAYVATPARLNPSKNWGLDRIAAVWQTAQGRTPSSEVLETTDGNLIPLRSTAKWDGKRESLQLIKKLSGRTRKLRQPGQP